MGIEAYLLWRSFDRHADRVEKSAAAMLKAAKKAINRAEAGLASVKAEAEAEALEEPAETTSITGSSGDFSQRSSGANEELRATKRERRRIALKRIIRLGDRVKGAAGALKVEAAKLRRAAAVARALEEKQPMAAAPAAPLAAAPAVAPAAVDLSRDFKTGESNPHKKGKSKSVGKGAKLLSAGKLTRVPLKGSAALAAVNEESKGEEKTEKEVKERR